MANDVVAGLVDECDETSAVKVRVKADLHHLYDFELICGYVAVSSNNNCIQQQA